MTDKIYVGCPYSGNMVQQEHRYKMATAYAGHLLIKGYLVYSPLTHCKPIADLMKLPHHAEFWAPMNLSQIEWCDIMHVLCLPGWEYSAGLVAERAWCTKLHKAVTYIPYEELQWLESLITGCNPT